MGFNTLNGEMRHYKFTIFFLFVLWGGCLSQTQLIDEKLFEWMNEHSRQELEQRLERIKSQYSNSPIPFYLEAYLTEDGERAAEIYQKIIHQFPKSRYSEAAMIKLGQFFFISKSYQRARYWFNKLVKDFPDSKYLALAYFYSGVSSKTLGDEKLAKETLEKFLKKFPDHQFAFYAQRIMSIPLQENPSPASDEPLEDALKKSNITVPESKKIFSVQIGAFSERKNAIRLKEKYSFLNQPIKIVTNAFGNKILYLVHVGKFASRSEAENFANDLKTNYGLNFRIVEK